MDSYYGEQLSPIYRDAKGKESAATCDIGKLTTVKPEAQPQSTQRKKMLFTTDVKNPRDKEPEAQFRIGKPSTTTKRKT